MALVASRRKRRPLTRGDYYSLLFILAALALAGPAIVLHAVYADHRDRPSLQWPKTAGTIMLCEQVYHSGKHSYYNVNVTYTYVVNERRYVAHQVALWNPDWHGGQTDVFVVAHPVRSAVDVYYNPQHPDNAVLIPGPDEAGNRTSILCGSIAFAAGVLLVFMMRSKLVSVKTAVQAAEARARTAKPAGLPHGFASYEPGCKRKLNVFPDRECVEEVLGQDDKPLQEWTPEDRMIDAAGREYRLVKEPDRNRYHLEPTGETWSYERLLDVAEADGRLLKKDPEAFRRRLHDVPAEDRMAVLFKVIDELPMAPRWVMAGFFLLLLLFFLAVVFVAGKLFLWLQKFRG